MERQTILHKIPINESICKPAQPKHWSRKKKSKLKFKIYKIVWEKNQKIHSVKKVLWFNQLNISDICFNQKHQPKLEQSNKLARVFLKIKLQFVCYKKWLYSIMHELLKFLRVLWFFDYHLNVWNNANLCSFGFFPIFLNFFKCQQFYQIVCNFFTVSCNVCD